MKGTRISIVILILSLNLLPALVVGQQEVKRDQSSGKNSPTIDLTALGKPTFSESSDGIKAQVWLVTREEHDRLISMPKEDQPMKVEQRMDSRKSTSSNPEVAIIVLDDLGGKVPIQDATLVITTKSPSGKPLTRGLVPARGHYATNLDFSEKGAYKLTLRISRNSKTTMMYFETPVSISLN